MPSIEIIRMQGAGALQAVTLRSGSITRTIDTPLTLNSPPLIAAGHEGERICGVRGTTPAKIGHLKTHLFIRSRT